MTRSVYYVETPCVQFTQKFASVTILLRLQGITGYYKGTAARDPFSLLFLFILGPAVLISWSVPPAQLPQRGIDRKYLLLLYENMILVAERNSTLIMQ